MGSLETANNIIGLGKVSFHFSWLFQILTTPEGSNVHQKPIKNRVIREQAKISLLSASKFNDWCLKGEELLSFHKFLRVKLSKKKTKKPIIDHGEKETKPLDSSNIFNKTNVLKQVQDIFLNKQLSNLIRARYY